MRTIPDSADNVTTKTNLLKSTYEYTGLGILFFVLFCFVFFFLLLVKEGYTSSYSLDYSNYQ